MVKIINSRLGTVISKYVKGSQKDLEKYTSTYDKVRHRYTPYTGFNLDYNSDNAFLTYQQPVNKIRTLFPHAEVVQSKVNPQLPLSHQFNVTVESLLPAQVEVLSAINDFIKKNVCNWFVNIQTGRGKTVLSTKLASELNTKMWVTCYSNGILDQWCDTFAEKTNIDQRRILRISSSSILKELIFNEISPYDYDVYICTPGLLTSFAKSLGDFSAINEVFVKCGIGLLVYDEAHRNVANLVKILAVSNVRYHLFLSADYSQADSHMNRQYQQIFTKVPIIQLDETLDQTLMYTDILVCRFNSRANEYEENSIIGVYGYNAMRYMKYQMTKGVMMEALLHLMKTTLKKNGTDHRMLVLFPTINHVNIAADMIKQMLADNDIDLYVGQYHQEIDRDTKDNVKQNANIIVSTYKSFSTGMDVDNIKYVYSMNQCNHIEDNQSAGRARPLKDGSNALYVMFVDDSISYCKTKLSGRLSYLMKTKSAGSAPYEYEYIDSGYTL